MLYEVITDRSFTEAFEYELMSPKNNSKLKTQNSKLSLNTKHSILNTKRSPPYPRPRTRNNFV